MFMLLESLRSALESIRAHGFRSLLTSLGIIIGVTSVIAVVSIAVWLGMQQLPTMHFNLSSQGPASQVKVDPRE